MSDLNRIEEEVERERAALTQTLDRLTTNLSPDRVATKLTSTVEGAGGEIGRQALDSAKRNPAAFALVAAGVGLLLSGTGSRSRLAEGSRLVPQKDAMSNFDERVAQADAQMRSRMTYESTKPKASWLKENLDAGLDALPASARARVVKLRRAAISAQEKVEAHADKAMKKTSDFHSNQPLAVGGLAFGLGALIAAMLPSTRREDELLGDHRDALMAQAQHALNTEMSRISRGAQEGIRSALHTSPSGRRTSAR